MKPTALNQTTARRYAKRAQAAFLVAGAGAVLIALWGTRASSPPAIEPLDASAEPPIATGRTDDRKAPLVDAHAVATRFDLIANHPTQDKTEPYEPPVEEKIAEVGDQEIRFLGVLIEPKRRLALLKIGERQRLIGAGESFLSGGEGAQMARLVEVADDHVIVETASGQKKIEKSLASGPSVTYLTGAAPSARGTMPSPSTDPMARARNLGRSAQLDSPIVPPPGARLLPADRRPQQDANGERQ